MTRRQTITLGIVVVVAVGAAAVYTLAPGLIKRAPVTREPGTSDTQQSTNASQSLDNATSAIHAGTARQCYISGLSEGQSILGQSYTDGNGRAVHLMGMGAGDAQSATLITPDKTYTWAAAANVPKTGFIVPTTAKTGADMQFTSGEATFNGMRATYDCSDWTVNEAVFQVPGGVRFVAR